MLWWKPKPLTDEKIARSMLMSVEDLRAHPTLLQGRRDIIAAKAALKADAPHLSREEKRERKAAIKRMRHAEAEAVAPYIIKAFSEDFD